MKNWLLAVSVIALISSQAPASAAAKNNAKFQQAVAHYKAGQYVQALFEFGAVVNANPADWTTHYYLALCHQALNHRSEARAEYQIVAQNGNAALKSYAAKGLAVLQAGKASSGGSAQSGIPSPMVNAPSSSPSAAATTGQGKVKKILKWYADWCGPCKAFAPVYDATKPKFRDITFQELDLDDPANAGLKAEYGIRSIPRLVMLDAGGKVLYNESPPRDPAELEATINRYR